jgi:putative ABC transport system permease protein
MWIPLEFSAADRANYEDRGLSVVARVKPGVTLEQAQAVMDTVSARLRMQHPKTNAGWSAQVSAFRGPEVTGVLRAAIFALLGAVVFVLMIVCSNVASMLLARGASRQGEMAIRAALGCRPAEAGPSVGGRKCAAGLRRRNRRPCVGAMGSCRRRPLGAEVLAG